MLTTKKTYGQEITIEKTTTQSYRDVVRKNVIGALMGQLFLMGIGILLLIGARIFCRAAGSPTDQINVMTLLLGGFLAVLLIWGLIDKIHEAYRPRQTGMGSDEAAELCRLARKNGLDAGHYHWGDRLTGAMGYVVILRCGGCTIVESAVPSEVMKAITANS